MSRLVFAFSCIFFVAWLTFLIVGFCVCFNDFLQKNNNEELNSIDYSSLIKMDVFLGSPGEIIHDKKTIVDDKILIERLKPILKDVTWEKGLDVARSKQSDARVSLFVSNKDKTEHLEDYFVWFDEVDGKTILQSDERASIGYVKDGDAVIFKDVLLYQKVQNDK